MINALQAKVLALQGRGGDTAVAHLKPGEMVVPRAVLTPQLAQLIAAEAAKRGINPKQLIVGSRKASINPATGTEEFGWFGDLIDDGVNTVKGWFGKGDKLDMSGVGPVTITRRSESIGAEPTSGTDMTSGATLYTADQFTRSAVERDLYNERVAHLRPNETDDILRRHEIKLKHRARTPKMVQDVLNKYRPLKAALIPEDVEYYKTKSPAKTNPKFNVAGKVMKALGPVGIAASAALATDQIARADNKVREAFGVDGSMLGGLGRGALGTAAGTLVAPRPGTIVGGVGGSVAGSYYGQDAGYDLYDNLNHILWPC